MLIKVNTYLCDHLEELHGSFSVHGATLQNVCADQSSPHGIWWVPEQQNQAQLAICEVQVIWRIPEQQNQAQLAICEVQVIWRIPEQQNQAQLAICVSTHTSINTFNLTCKTVTKNMFK